MKEYFARAAALMTAIKMHSTKDASSSSDSRGAAGARQGCRVARRWGRGRVTLATIHAKLIKQRGNNYKYKYEAVCFCVCVCGSMCVNGSDVKSERERDGERGGVCTRGECAGGRE